MRAKEITLRPVAQKVLLLLTAGVILGLSTSPAQHFRIIKATAKAWKDINKRALYRAIRRLYQARLIDAKDNPDGTTTMMLTQNGKQKALTCQIDEMQIKPMAKWDGYWRVVLSDIPEQHKKARDAMYRAFKKMGLYPFQKSVMIHPFECQDEVDFVVEFFNLRPYVRTILAKKVDNELHLKKIFKL